MSERKLKIGLPLGQLVVLLVGILVVYLAVDFGRQVAISQQVHAELDRAEQAVAAAEQKKEALADRLEYAKSDEAAEEWARNQGMVQEGEVLVVIVPSPGEPAPAREDAPTPAEESLTNQQLWLDLFFGER